MSGFHDMVKADLAVFLNADEFAETHTINGVSVLCVIDTDSTGDVGSSLSSSLEGVFLNTQRVFFKKGAFTPPAVDKQVRIDGSRHTVRNVRYEMDMVVMTVEEYQGP